MGRAKPHAGACPGAQEPIIQRKSNHFNTKLVQWDLGASSSPMMARMQGALVSPCRMKQMHNVDDNNVSNVLSEIH
jgi:hypothetical protein